MKPCNKCKVVKAFSEFSLDKITKDGHKGICKRCDCAIKRSNYNKKQRIYPVGMPKGVTQDITKRQRAIAKYGLATVEALDGLGDY